MQITNYLTKKDIIPKYHYGSQSGISTTDAISSIHEFLKEKKFSNIPSILILLDMSAAYDMVCHITLIRKMKHIGFSIETLELMENYLKNRSQTVQVNGHYSKVKVIVPRSVIQGSV